MLCQKSLLKDEIREGLSFEDKWEEVEDECSGQFFKNLKQAFSEDEGLGVVVA